MKVLAFLAAAIVAVATTAQATPINWAVDQLSLTDGSAVSGGFTYDATLDLVSNINITLTTSSPGSPYTLTNQFYPTGGGVFFGFTETAAADYTGQATLWIQVASALTDAGGSVPINTGAGYGWGVCSVPSCTTASNPGDLSGNLAAAAVPEPATLTLISLGLAGVAASRKRRSDRSQAGVRLS
jgi:hypothetical protein